MACTGHAFRKGLNSIPASGLSEKRAANIPCLREEPGNGTPRVSLPGAFRQIFLYAPPVDADVTSLA